MNRMPVKDRLITIATNLARSRIGQSPAT